MNKRFKYILSILYVLFIYITLFSIFIFKDSRVWIFLIIAFILGSINIAMAFIYGFNKDKDALLYNGIILKCSMIAAYSFIFILALSAATILTMFIGFFSLITALPAFILDVLMLIVSSSYLISYLIVDYKENNNKWNFLHVVLQFLFVFDVIDTIVVSMIKDKKNRLFSVLLMALTTIIPIIAVIIFALIYN